MIGSVMGDESANSSRYASAISPRTHENFHSQHSLGVRLDSCPGCLTPLPIVPLLPQAPMFHPDPTGLGVARTGPLLAALDAMPNGGNRDLESWRPVSPSACRGTSPRNAFCRISYHGGHDCEMMICSKLCTKGWRGSGTVVVMWHEPAVHGGFLHESFFCTRRMAKEDEGEYGYMDRCLVSA